MVFSPCLSSGLGAPPRYEEIFPIHQIRAEVHQAKAEGGQHAVRLPFKLCALFCQSSMFSSTWYFSALSATQYSMTLFIIHWKWNCFVIVVHLLTCAWSYDVFIVLCSNFPRNILWCAHCTLQFISLCLLHVQVTFLCVHQTPTWGKELVGCSVSSRIRLVFMLHACDNM